MVTRNNGYRTVDGGLTFTRLFELATPGSILTAAVSAAEPHAIYIEQFVETHGPLLRASFDDGATWVTGQTPVRSRGCLTVHPARRE
ncbi:MAG: hypothetical protein KA712_20890 [Myxococcales bacterium]|nr:hypothetical protein [Myxococcales bacterium]